MSIREGEKMQFKLWFLFEGWTKLLRASFVLISLIVSFPCLHSLLIVIALQSKGLEQTGTTTFITF